MTTPAEDDRTVAIIRDLRARWPLGIPPIKGWRLTYHAAARMKVRDIDISELLEALQAPGRICGDNLYKGLRKHIGRHAAVVVNPDTREIVTVGHNGTTGTYE